MADTITSHAARSPLAEASNRINSPFSTPEGHHHKPRHEHPLASHAIDLTRPNYAAANTHAYHTNRGAAYAHPAAQSSSSHRQPAHVHSHAHSHANAHASAHHSHAPPTLKPPQESDEHKRLSQASHDSSASGHSKKHYKTHIGPWQLGKTLGKGSSARVRLCRHNVTKQLAAVKIVNRRMAYMVQDSSLAALSKWDSSFPEQINGEMRVPMSIEREVAILKLIEHPNIMKLYDIWENRSEVYLILEYIDQGDLFTFINAKGKLSEEVAIYFFRQMISAITYCHSFNICHRDLKPENILISADLQIKIADFGMAALHQTDTHQLATACGSPHYAAPELLKNRQYRGDRADIWSMGVILYAMLSASLPFDDPDISVMLSRTKRGQYQMPEELSPEAQDLIRRMLQVNPDRRITLREIWRHPLIQKFAYLDDIGDPHGQLGDTRKGFQYSPVPPQDIDSQLVRQLRSMWHMFTEAELKQKLTSDEPNDQKAFYWLLSNYREKQLEDFKPEIAHSVSDYHHLKPGVWKKRVSTCDFAQTRANGHGRSISRFTVISNIAETEAGTVQSYDPYRGSRMLKPSNSQVTHAKVTVHRDYQSTSTNYAAQAARLRSGSGARRGRVAVRTSTTGRLQSSKGSVSSLQSRQGSRQGTPHARPSLRHKRGVDFSHVRKRSSSAAVNKICPAPSYVTEQGSTYQIEKVRSRTPEIPSLPSGVLPKRSEKTAQKAAQEAAQEVAQEATQEVVQEAPVKPDQEAAIKPAVRPGLESKDASVIFHEELRHFSSNIAKDCDEAFRSSLIEEESIAGSLADIDRALRESTPFSFSIESPAMEEVAPERESMKSVPSRPLPPLPSTSDLDDQSMMPTPLVSRPTSREDAPEVPSDQIKLALPVLLPRHSTDRRVVSAPAYGQIQRKPVALPSINETGVSSDKSRIVSAPPHTPVKSNERTRSMEYLSKVEPSIRVVHSPSAPSPMKVPAPLNVRKIINTDEPKKAEPVEEIVADTSIQESQGGMKKKKSWFKRSSKVESEPGTDAIEWHDCTSVTAASDAKQTDSNSSASATKKKSFSFPFWKSSKARDSGMSISREPEDKDVVPVRETQVIAKSSGHVARGSTSKWHESSSGAVRNIEVKQNWLARLFRVKPATSYLCMAISRRRSRQEVTILLREWRKFGLRGIQVDKQRNLVFGRVGAKNYLNLKEVSFAAEVMTVIEHGKKQPLSIIRFTQERGAASSFHRVVDTMKVVFDSRGLLVNDRNKQKMMIKTLNS